MLHMFGIDIGDDRNGRGQFVKRPVAFISLNNHPIAIAHARIGSIGLNDPSIDDGGINAACIEQARHHGRRRCFAMRTRNRHIRPQAHQLGQHLGPAHNRQARGPCRIQFGISGLDRA